MKTNIKSFTLDELKNEMISLGQKPFRAEQIFKWIHQENVQSFDDMTNLSKDFREALKEKYDLHNFKIIRKLESKDGTKKFLFDVLDGNAIESVLMQYKYGYTICVSSQVGCKMGCKFCASTGIPFSRNLEAGEIVEQILAVQREENVRISNIVFMGIGEPLDNYDNVIRFIRILNHPKSFAIGARHITVSTCGIVPKIELFMKDESQVNLAISLHAPNNQLRSKLMKINKAYPLEKLMPVLKRYIDVTHRRLTFEYILLSGVNDTTECALELSQLLRGMNCYVNLIPYNETSHFEYKKSSQERILNFLDVLKKNHIQATIRREFGSKVQAACGQLRSNYEEG